MAWGAQRLPVWLIPEDLPITTMCSHMIDDGRGRQLTFFLTVCAEGMIDEEMDPRLLPARIVTTRRRASSPLIDFSPLLLPVLQASAGTPVHQNPASRVAAWTFWRERTHAAFLFSWMGGFAFLFKALCSSLLTGDLPFSITYPGRWRSSL
jgi:hypothetical protein